MNNFRKTHNGFTWGSYVSLEDYFLLEKASSKKHEYLEGSIVAVTGATEEHNRIVANLLREVGGFLKGKDCDIFPANFHVSTPLGSNYFYPDATVVCGDTQMQPQVFDTLLNLALIFEVMSEGTKRIDKGYKFFHYQQILSLQEYILIDSEKFAVDVIRRQADGAWKFEQYFPVHKTFPVQSIGMNLSFDDVYYRVLLPA